MLDQLSRYIYVLSWLPQTVKAIPIYFEFEYMLKSNWEYQKYPYIGKQLSSLCPMYRDYKTTMCKILI